MLRRYQGKHLPPTTYLPPIYTNPPHQGIVYDVTGNKAYQPGGAYSGKPSPSPPPFHHINQPTPFPVYSLRRQGRLARAGQDVDQGRGRQRRLAGPARQGEVDAQRLGDLFFQAV